MRLFQQLDRCEAFGCSHFTILKLYFYCFLFSCQTILPWMINNYRMHVFSTDLCAVSKSSPK